MRILRLDLLKFGPFEGQSIEFDRGVGLHIVQGPNEAGKSSSLRAVQYLLFGFPTQTKDNFLHANASLRIGGVIETSSGARWEFIRRKGRKQTLRQADDVAAFDETQLLALLGGMDEATFENQHGIGYSTLRSGGGLVANGKGELGEILFAASSGIGDLRKIRDSLDAEAGELFKPGGSKPRMNETLTRLKTARTTIRDCQLPSDEWDRFDRGLRDAEARLQAIDRELMIARIERSRQERILKSIPEVAKYRATQGRLDQAAHVPLLYEHFAADRRELQTNLENAVRARHRAVEEIERLERERSKVNVPAGLLDHQTAISQIHANLGRYQQVTQERPRTLANAERAERQTRQLLQESGAAVSREEIESLRISKLQRARIQELAKRHPRLLADRDACDQTVRDLAAQQQRSAEDLAALPATRDATDLEHAVRAAQKQGDLDARLRVVQQQLDANVTQARVELARLAQFDGTLDELEQLPIPSAETIDRFENLLTDADATLDRASERIEAIAKTVDELAVELDTLRREVDVPTESDLDAARARRDAGWSWVERTLQGAAVEQLAETRAFIAEFAADGSLRTAFRASLEKADLLADRLRREADRVAVHARLTADLQQARARREDAELQWQRAKETRDGIQRDWCAQWRPSGITPLTPREMRAWRRPYQQLVEIAVVIRQRRSDAEALRQNLTSTRDELQRCLTCHSESTPPEQRSLAALLECGEQAVERIRRTELAREQATRDLETLHIRLAEALRKRDEQQVVLADWHRDWADAVVAFGLTGDAKPSEVLDLMTLLDEMFAAVDEASKLQERIVQIDAEADAYRSDLSKLVESVAPDLNSTVKQSVERAVADLVDRTNQAVQDHARLESWKEQLQNLQVARADAEEQIELFQGKLAELCKLAGCDSAEELPEAETQSTLRREAERELNALGDRLRELAAGKELDEWMSMVEQADADRLQADYEQLEEKIATLEREKLSISEEIGKFRNELARMDGSGKAADTQLELEQLLASFRSDAEEYVRRRLASMVLERAMERFRDANQGPVIARAGELFAGLTCGSFATLRTDFGEGDKPVLMGVRSDGSTVDTAGMSDGTCDQLFLALRLAFLEMTPAGREPLPLVVDDILITFDDERAAAALRALAELSRKRQVIFFTHHDHLVEVAQQSIEGFAICRLGA